MIRVQNVPLILHPLFCSWLANSTGFVDRFSPGISLVLNCEQILLLDFDFSGAWKTEGCRSLDTSKVWLLCKCVIGCLKTKSNWSVKPVNIYMTRIATLQHNWIDRSDGVTLALSTNAVQSKKNVTNFSQCRKHPAMIIWGLRYIDNVLNCPVKSEYWCVWNDYG